jgi:N-acetylmuramoyl-L-alanine amidase/Putative peptidoglycan binding domain
VGGSELSRRTLLIGGLVGGLTAAGAVSGPGTAMATEPPPFIDCAGWGARPPSAAVPVWDRRPVKILVHHTASQNVADLSRAAADRLARTIQDFHMDRRGWIDSGQHLTISRGGFVLEGRHRTLEALAGGTRQVEGAHCPGQNVLAVGIENEGTYGDVDPPAPLWDRLRQTCAHICLRYAIAPTEIYGHRDFKNTACPGNRLYGLLPRLRSEVAGLLGRRVEGVAAQRASWPLVQRGDTGERVLAAQHLLRASGLVWVRPTGVADQRTEQAIRAFQAGHGAEEVNGLLGGESWPVLAAAATRAGGPETERAVRALTAGRRVEAAPGPLTAATWQRLLGTGGAPVDRRTDPPGTRGR